MNFPSGCCDTARFRLTFISYANSLTGRTPSPVITSSPVLLLVYFFVGLGRGEPPSSTAAPQTPNRLLRHVMAPADETKHVAKNQSS